MKSRAVAVAHLVGKLALTVVLAACAGTTSQAPPPAPSPSPAVPATATADTRPLVYVGGYRSEIAIFRLDLAGARLEKVGSADGGKSPSFLAFHPEGRFVFAANETSDGRVTAFSVDRATGALTRINDASSAGFGPAHLSVDRSGKWVLVANYADPRPGTIGVLPIGPDGRLGEPVARHDFGPATMPHFISVDPSNGSVFVPCKGGPYVGQFRFDATSGQLTAASPDRVAAAKGAGPRHLAFHPNGRFAFVINESDLTVTSYTLADGKLTPIATVPTIPADVKDRKGLSTADVHVHPSGKWLYGSNRGHDSIVQFSIDESTGRLTLVGHVRDTIKKPRNFHLDPTGQLALVANQEGASISIFRIDPSTGRLTLAGEPTPAGDKPSFVGVLPQAPR